MGTYKLLVQNRLPGNWIVEDNLTNQKKQINLIDPYRHKLFSNDLFTYTNDIVNILSSPIRVNSDIPGVLILKSNKTYGRIKNKLLYKCIPNDVSIPPFLIPYEIKNIGFSKNFINLYVTFQFNNWDNKHPHGTLSGVIGSVDVLNHFYEYQLNCKSLNSSIQNFHKQTKKTLQGYNQDLFMSNIKNKHCQIESRLSNEYKIISIDPDNCTDIDDALSISYNDNQIKLSVYISNVPLLMDELNLWEFFSNRVSTIYLPDIKRPMLPTILSDCLFSLQENKIRIAFFMDVIIEDNSIVDIKYGNSFIKVAKNYCYEESKLINSDYYKELFRIVKNLNQHYKFIDELSNSHDIISYLMVLMNFQTSKDLLVFNKGIFRRTLFQKSNPIPKDIPTEVSNFIKIWKSYSGEYINVETVADKDDYKHNSMNLDSYIHITSPIRRLVDLLNMIKIQELYGIISLSPNANEFYDKWMEKIEYINISMRSIRKIQCDCNLLALFHNNPNVMDKEYIGYTFDKLFRTESVFEFMVYIPELKLTSKIVTIDQDIDNYQIHHFKLFLFIDEENFKKKVRLHKI